MTNMTNRSAGEKMSKVKKGNPISLNPERGNVEFNRGQIDHLDLARLEDECQQLRNRILDRDRHIEHILSSTSWRVTRPLRALFTLARQTMLRVRLVIAALRPNGQEARQVLARAVYRRLKSRSRRTRTPIAEVDPSYEDWLNQFETITCEDRALIESQLASGLVPSVGVVTVVSDTESANRVSKDLADQIAKGQFTLVLMDGSLSCNAQEHIKHAFDGLDSVVFLDPGSNLPHLPPVEAYLITDGAVRLRPHSIATFACELRNHDADLVYSDEDVVAADGRRSDPYFKPQYSPRRAASTGYIGECGLIRAITPLDSIVAGLRSRSVSALLTGIAAELPRDRITRSPFILFSDTRAQRGSSAISDIQNAPRPTVTKVSIIIPTRDRLQLLRPCIDSLIEKTKYPKDDFEIIIVDNGSRLQESLDYFASGVASATFRVIRDDSKFNYARLNNLAAASSIGDVLVFLNNDTIIEQPDWLQRMVEDACRTDVGAVGVKLLYPDRTVQHGGVILGIEGVAGHAHLHGQENDPGYHGLALLDHEVAAVTGACLAMRRSVFDEIGGFDESLAVAFNDCLLCVRALQHGYYNVVLNTVRVIHLESKSRGLDSTPEKLSIFRRECIYARSQANELFLEDPYYSPNLSLQIPYRLAPVPRRRKPWRDLRFSSQKPKILMLSITHKTGHGVPIVMAEQARYLATRDHEVYIGGPNYSHETEIEYPSCRRVTLNDPFSAALYAYDHNVDCIVPQTPPFFSVARYAGKFPKVMVYDYGEPPVDLFPDKVSRQAILDEKFFVFGMAHRLCGISESVRDEASRPDMQVIPLANSHLAHWDTGMTDVRARVRARERWTNCVVVLNVCRFHEAERRYKGIDLYIETAKICCHERGVSEPNIVFVMCGRAHQSDIDYVEAAGLTVKSNVSDEEMIELYAAADVYANFSRWEGWNLGIAQALAFGLPVVASDIPSHRKNFAVPVAANPLDASGIINQLAVDVADADFNPIRMPLIKDWDNLLEPFASEIERLIRDK